MTKGLYPALVFQNLCYGRLDDFISFWSLRFSDNRMSDIQSKWPYKAVASLWYHTVLSVSFFHMILDLLSLMGPGDRSDRAALTFEE